MIACRSQVSSNNMLSNKHSRYHYHILQYMKTVLIQESVRIQENDTNTGVLYEYGKMLLIQEIGTNTGNNTVLKNSISKDFKHFATINKRIIVELSSR